jgi:hypothetical protein
MVYKRVLTVRLARVAVTPTAPRVAHRRPTASRPPSHTSPVAPPSRPSRVPTAAVRSRAARTAAVPARPPRRSPVTVVPRRRPRAGEPPFLAVSHALASCRRRLTEQRRRREAPPPHARAVRHARRPCPVWPRAAPALCIWAERGFGSGALKFFLYFSDLFNSLQIQKFV